MKKSFCEKKRQVSRLLPRINALPCISIMPFGGFDRHRHALESVHEIDRIYQSNNNLFRRLSLFHLSSHQQTASGSLNMCRVAGRADDFWEAPSRRLTWRCRGKCRLIITARPAAAGDGDDGGSGGGSGSGGGCGCGSDGSVCATEKPCTRVTVISCGVRRG